MIIAAVQIRSLAGDVSANVDSHLAAIRQAASHGADMVVFPELSLTGYEPSLAEQLAFEQSDSRLAVFRDESTQLGITIGAGMPTRASSKPMISHAFFRPNTPEAIYSKQRLHEDELSFFQAGEEQLCLDEHNERLVPAICYESLVPEHAAHAAELGATTYIACVAKPVKSAAKAHAYFPQTAKQYQFVVIMCNAIGSSDNFISAGRSAAWNRNGEVMAAAGANEECLLLVDLASESASIEPLNRN